MSSVRALKRKSIQKQSKHRENTISNSWPNVTVINRSDSSLKRSKSESDLQTATSTPKKDLKIHAKSERNLQSLYSNFTTSTPFNMSQVSPTSTTMQTSTYSIVSDPEQIKVPIVGYEGEFSISFCPCLF